MGSREPHARAVTYLEWPDEAQLAFVRICAHYYGHYGWFEEDGQLIRNAGRLAGVPGVLLHGWHDLSCPVETAWEPALAWPGA